MPDLTDTLIRLYRKFFATPGGQVGEKLPPMVLDGDHAVAMAEASMGQTAVLWRAFPAGSAATAWRSEVDQRRLNSFGRPIRALAAESGRGAISAAIGQALAGQRTTAFLQGHEVAAVQDLLAVAAGRQLPLVLHLTATGLPAQGFSLDTGHESIHLCADSGCFVLVASSVQQALDFTYLARRVAERTLVPGLVVMDDAQTARSVQQVQLLSREQIDRFVGAAGDSIESPTPAQELLFGANRRRVPRWYQLDRPILRGALNQGTGQALGSLGRQAFFGGAVAQALDAACAEFARITGREQAPLVLLGHQQPQLVLVALGAAVETAGLAASELVRARGQRVGVLGLHQLRPLPETLLCERLRDAKSIVVLERASPGLGGDLPLLKELRACLARGAAVPGGSRKEQRLRSVCYGLGGMPLTVADLLELPAQLDSNAHPQLVLGARLGGQSDFPKRQVLLDRLQRAYPDLAGRELRSGSPTQPAATVTLAIHRSAGQCAGLLHLAADQLHQILGGRVRSRCGLSVTDHAAPITDLLACGDDSLGDPGDRFEVGLALVAGRLAPTAAEQTRLAGRLAVCREGALLLPGAAQPPVLAAALLDLVKRQSLRVYLAPAEPPGLDERGRQQLLLGSLLAVLVAEKRIEESRQKLFALHERNLDQRSPDERPGLIAAFRQGFEGTQAWAVESQAAPATSGSLAAAPAAPRVARQDDQYDSLPRFWDQVAVAWQQDQMETLSVDPYFVTGAVAPMTAGFADLSGSRRSFPQFDPAACTGCGDCWTACPDSAIGTLAIAPRSLVDQAIRLTGAEALRQIAGPLGQRLAAQARDPQPPAASAGEALAQAWEWLSQRMSLAEDRRQAIEGAINKARSHLQVVPLAVTEPFFGRAEAAQKDTGQLLGLFINPDACKACGLCQTQCQSQAIQLVEQREDKLAAARAAWQLWRELPDTPAATVERLAADPGFGAARSSLLSRHCLLSMAGGDGAEAGSGEKIALHLVLSLAEYHQQQVNAAFAHSIQETYLDLNNLIKQQFARVLPLDDLAELDESLDDIRAPRFDMSTLAAKVAPEVLERSLDTNEVRRMVQLSRELADQSWRYTQGINGLGRSRFGLAVAPGTLSNWAGAFPSNPFQVPVQLDFSGDSADLALGLIEGHLEDALETIGLLRAARLEIDRPAGAGFLRAALDRLTWRDLNEQERRLCAPMLLVGGDALLAGQGLSQVLWLLRSGLPIRILVLSALDFGLTAEQPLATRLAANQEQQSDLTMLALAAGDAYVAQTSVSHPEHLAAVVSRAFAFEGPALLNLCAPSPGRHGFPADQTVRRAALAVQSRVFPLLEYDPARQGVFGSRLSLAGNPAPDAEWVEQDAVPLTPLHWARGEDRFASHFSQPEDDQPAPLDVLAWNALDASARRNKTPGFNGEQVTPELAGVVERVARRWRTLQELAGVVTPFTAEVERKARAELTAEHLRAMDELKASYERQLVELRAQVSGEMAGRVRDRLLGMLAQAPRRAAGDRD